MLNKLNELCKKRIVVLGIRLVTLLLLIVVANLIFRPELCELSSIKSSLFGLITGFAAYFSIRL